MSTATRRASGLDSERLLTAAAEQTGLSDFGDLPFREAIDAMLWALAHESGHLPERVASVAESLLLPALVKRLRLVDDRKRYPEIAAQEVRRRSSSPACPAPARPTCRRCWRPGRAPAPRWNGRCGSRHPPPQAATFATDPRIAEVQRAIDARANAARLQAIHPYGAQRPEQCLGLIDWGFVNQTYLAYQRIPSYYECYLDADQRVIYEHHRRMLQHLQARNPGEWVLKWPKHLFGLDALLEVYPDARIVWTHRDPAKVIPSSVSFVGTLRSMNSPLFDPRRFGAEWTALEEMGLQRGLSVRDRVGEDRFLDVHYNDLTADPVGHGDPHLPALCASRSTTRPSAGCGDFTDENPQGKHGAHQYTPRTVRLRARAGPPPLRGLHRAVRHRARPPASRQARPPTDPLARPPPPRLQSGRHDERAGGTGVRAAVLTAAETLGIEAFPVPRLGEDDALIRVEVCGLGGSDVTQYLGKLRPSSTVYPVILGHVFVGVVESIGQRAARRWRVAPGDRVVTEAIVPCWACPPLRLRALLAVRRGRGPAPLRADLGRPRAAPVGRLRRAGLRAARRAAAPGLPRRPARRPGAGELDRLGHALGRGLARIRARARSAWCSGRGSAGWPRRWRCSARGRTRSSSAAGRATPASSRSGQALGGARGG